MKLRLPFPPTPEFAPKHAAQCVSLAMEVDKVELDYSVESLEKVDDIIEGFRREGVTSEQIAETLFIFGCYVGEVFVRNGHGRWRVTDETPMAELAGFPLVIQLGPPDASYYCNPIGKTFKRLENGMEDNIPFFYQGFTSDRTGGEAAPKPWYKRLFGK